MSSEFFTAYDQAKPWKVDHDAAMRCFEAEELVAIGNLGYRLITDLEAAWQDWAASGRIPYDDEDSQQIDRPYHKWIVVTRRNLDEIESLNQEGYAVQGAEELLAHLEEATCLLESRELEAGMRPIEEVIPMAQGNPRLERYGK